MANTNLIKVETSTGFKCEVDPAAQNDMELLDLLVRLDEGDLIAYSKAATLLIGAENKRALYDHIRDEHGRVPVERFEAELKDIIDGMRDEKK